MYCFINTKSRVAITDVPDLVKNLTAKPIDNNFKGKFGNLRVFIKANGEYYIKGSIWKYIKGNNTEAISHQEFLNAISELDSLTFGTFSHSRVIGYEVGINIITKHEPSAYLIPMVGSKLKKRNITMNPDYKKNVLWARRSAGTAHCFKGYNKSFENNMAINCLRIEYCVKNSKMALGRSLTIEDLKSLDYLHKQYDIIKSFADNLVFQGEYNPEYLASLKPQDKWRYMTLCNNNVSNPRALLNCMGFDVATKSREYKHIMKLLIGNQTDDSLLSELKNKVHLILN